MSFTQTIEVSKVEAIPAPFRNTKGTATLKILNSDQSLGRGKSGEALFFGLGAGGPRARRRFVPRGSRAN